MSLDTSPQIPADRDITRLLERVNDGDRSVRDTVITLLYQELRQLASRRLARTPRATIQPTELVHEMYGRLFSDDQRTWQNRAQFFAIAARAMQDVVVERARAASAQKRGGGMADLPLSQALDAAVDGPEDLLLLDLALRKLEEMDPLSAQVVQLRYFVGLSGDETAEALNVSPSTVDRRWTFARAWLHRELYPAD